MSATSLTSPDRMPGSSSLDGLKDVIGGRRLSRSVAIDLVAAADALSVVVGATIPAIIYAAVGNPITAWQPTLQLGLLGAIIVVMCLRAWGMYSIERMDELPQNASQLLGALFLACAALLGLGLPFPGDQLYLWIWYGTWISTSFTLLLAIRLVARPLLAQLARKGCFDERVAVFGAGVIARRVHDYLLDPQLGVSFIGVYDDRSGQDRLNPEGLAVAGRLDDLVALGRTNALDRVIIALPPAADSRIADVARKLEQLPVSLHVVTHISSDLVEKGPAHAVSSVGPVGLLDVKAKPLSDWAPLVKRAEDIVLASLFILVFLPLFLIAALAVKLESRGPVFYAQRRRGMNQEVFTVYKFRTMTVTEDDGEIRQAQPGDPRVTRVGRFLRRSSMDELPQLFNVLKGDMSLVGPRPHALVHDEQFGEALEQYVNRHQVKPGITGLAQVRGFRGETGTEEQLRKRVEHDLDYINNWSLWLDIKILFQALMAVFTGNNAH